MKRTILLILLLEVTLMGFAQENKRIQRPFIPKHEIRLGVGAIPLVPDIGVSYGTDYDRYFPHNLSDIYDTELIYAGSKYVTGALSAGYTYDLKRWLSVGGTFSYFGHYRSFYDKITDVKLASHNIHNLSLTAMLRFTYFNRRYVRLYSQIGIGLGMATTEGKATPSKTKFHFTGQLTPFGIAIGNKVFGFGEFFGAGNQGFMVLGIGYRFN